METSNRIYTSEQTDVIISCLKGTRYVEETQAELVKMGENYSNGYIQRVFGRFSYSETVWDALKIVALNRQQKRKNNADLMNQLVTENAE